MIKCIILFIPGMTWTIVIQCFVRMILFNSSWFNTGICIHNTPFLWYITANSRPFTRFNCLYVNPRTIWYTNTKKIWCESTRNKTKNLGARNWIFLMPQIKVTIFDVFDFSYKFIPIKWTILVIKVSLISSKYVFSKIHLVFRYSVK